MDPMQVARIAVNLMGKAVLLAARWAAARRKRTLEIMAARPDGNKDKEIIFLRDRVAQLQSQVEILRQLHKPDNTTRYTLRERFNICRVPLIRGVDHLAELCSSFLYWYNEWRPHMTLDGSRPVDVYCRDLPEPVARDAKVVPLNIERCDFAETRVTGFRLLKVA